MNALNDVVSIVETDVIPVNLDKYSPEDEYSDIDEKINSI